MELQLYIFRERGPRLESPSLAELLDTAAPFLFTQPGRRGDDIVVYGEWQDWHPTERLLKGVIVVDFEHKCQYYAKKPSRAFERRNGTGYWHSDKFNVFANRYRLSCSFPELCEEFKKLGFTFPDLSPSTSL